MVKRHSSFLLMLLLVGLIGLVTVSSVRAEKVKVVIWEWISTQGEGPVYKQILDNYRKSHPNVEIEMINDPWNQAHDKLLLMNAAQKMPDVIAVNRNWLMEFNSLNLLEDLTPYVKKVPGMREKYYAAERGELNKKAYILPYSGGNSALVYNAKVFREKGLEPPKTLDEFVAIGKKLSDPANNKYGVQFCLSEKNTTGANVCNIGPVLTSFGGQYIKGKKAAFNNSQGVAALQWMIDLEKSKIAAPGSITVDAKGMRESFAAERTYMSFDGSWGTPFYNQFPGLEFKVAKMPKGMKIGTVINIMCWGISKSSKNKAAAWDLLSYLENDDNMLKLFREANVMPCIAKYGEMPEFQEKYKGFLETLKETNNYFQTGSVPNETELYKLIDQAYQEAFLGAKTPKAALDDAAKEYNKLLNAFYTQQK